ncbi:MAG: SRPBCC family protein [Pseudomonadota bacterium]
MNFIKKLFKSLLILIVILAVVGFFLPSSTRVDRTVSISAPADKVFPYINNFEQFNRWSPWFGIDPDASTTYSGPDEGVGAKMSWTSEHPQVGNGSQEIVESVANKFVRTRLDFAEQGGAEATFSIAESGTGSDVTWAFESEWGFNLVGRYIGLMLDGMVGDMYDKGLSKLKQLVESE